MPQEDQPRQVCTHVFRGHIILVHGGSNSAADVIDTGFLDHFFEHRKGKVLIYREHEVGFSQ